MSRCPIVAIVLAVAGCGGLFHRMPDRPVLWHDPDRATFARRPTERYVSWRFDALDHLLFRPASEVWTLPTETEAINVNALDEVPDSSFFENRIGRFGMSAEEVARGACDQHDLDAPFPWTVVGGKPDGTNPGFTIEDANGTRYLLKTDGLLQPERASAADTIAAALYHAAGYFVPCNRVAYFRRDQLHIAPDAEAETTSGQKVPLRREHVEIVLRAATRTPDGTYRAALSRFIEGEPVGPWSYDEILTEDPNDIVPHNMRRDLRGLYVLAAWTGHIDSRQENTMSSWIRGSGRRGYLRHYILDFGDCFGILHPNDQLSRRFEHDHYLNLGTVLIDYATAGAIDRPWQSARLGRAGRTLGYFDAERFAPDEWAPGYPNPAFDAHTEHDAAWMARIAARFSRRHIAAAVSAGRFSDRIVREELTRILMERRNRILLRYLTRLSPLAWPRTHGRMVCLDDLALQSGIRARSNRRYDAWIAASEPSRSLSFRGGPTPDGRVCMTLPPGLRYVALDVVAHTNGRERTLPARLHLYAGQNGYRAVALERLDGETRR